MDYDEKDIDLESPTHRYDDIYNYMGFNITEEATAKRISLVAHDMERVAATIGPALRIPLHAVDYERVECSIELTKISIIQLQAHDLEQVKASKPHLWLTYLDKAQSLEHVTADKSRLWLTYLDNAQSLEHVTAEAHLGLTYFDNAQSLETTNANIHLGLTYFDQAQSLEHVMAQAHLGLIFFDIAHSIERVEALIRLGFREYLRGQLNVTIPPNGEVRINADNFTAMLITPQRGQGNPENIRHLYTGDWIMLNRDAINLNINASGNMPIDGHVIYEVRWL